MADLTDRDIQASLDQELHVFGETVILRSDPLGSPVDASVIEEIVPPDVAGPWHRHSREDEVSYVVEGTFRIWRGDEVFDIGPGGVALLPRDQAHTFQNIGPGTGRLLTVITPAGLERFFQVVAERELGEDDLDEVVAIAAEFGVEILGPPPE
ncbi:Cupin 2, barrel domain protein [Rubellimicrobium mesophilum DSM 19309]|uniref:Cupin 2, barrel domain protein n=1 Tax=Rubellimicrobium mesophilum DSM 19309 TaxID=442562 RepID=A0A017HLU3_9RHOB|nr:cupin domain-containing protein [Rubellimicrobium mesophilum]EYD74749.1 Cupin 2, barrel domain protein [Rubellimicrobium mesophilum DSM 19309]